MSHRVLYISANGFPSSTKDPKGTFSLEHANALRELGVEVDAVDMSRDAFGKDTVEGLTIQRVPRLRGLLSKFDIRGLLKYAALFFSFGSKRHDVVILGFFYLKYLPLVLWLRVRGRPVITTAYGGEVMPAGVMWSTLQRWMFRLVDVVMPCSDFTEAIFSCLVKRRRSDDEKIVTIYCGVDPDKLQPEISREESRQSLQIEETDFVVLSVCNLVKRKGIDLLVKAVDKLLEEGRPLRHVIIGRGPEREHLAELANRNGHGERFTFIDSVESRELANLYQMADLFALVSVTDWEIGQVEGFGIVYAEAMALGTPVIGGGRSGTTTPVKHGLTGLLVDPHRARVVDDVASAICRFMDDEEFYRQVSEVARRHVAEQFSWEGNARLTKAVIDGVLENRRV